MAKKQEKAIDEISIAKKLVLELDSKAFEYCRDALFEIFSFKCLEKKDLRPVDLCEQVLVSIKECEDSIKNSGSLCFYSSLLKDNIKDYCVCVDGSRANRYKEKALKLLSVSTFESIEYEAISDATMIYLSLSRENFKDGSLTKKKIEEASFEEKVEDIEILKAVYNGAKSHSGMKLKISKQAMTDERRKFFLIYSTIFLAKGLQSRGLL